MKDFLNLRVEALNQEKFEAEVNHSLRLHSLKATNNQINNNPNLYFNNETQKWEKYTNKTLEKFGKSLKEDFQNETEKWKKLHNANRHLHKKGFEKFPKTYSSFVFTFSEKFQNDFERAKEQKDHKWVNELLQSGKEAAEEFCNTFKCDLKYLTLHLDEKGLPHFQGMTTNYNSLTGKKLNIQTNKKNGEICQDILFNNFKSMGYKRGISKEITKKRHTKTHNYKAQQDNLKEYQNKIQVLEEERENLEMENLHLKNQNEKLQEIIQNLTSQKNQLSKKMEGIETEFQNSLLEIYNDFTEKSKSNADKFFLSFSRIVKNKSDFDEDRFFKLMKKYKVGEKMTNKVLDIAKKTRKQVNDTQEMEKMKGGRSTTQTTTKGNN